MEKNGPSKARPSRAPEGSYVGATPADRDAATLAAAQPLTTLRRRRLEEDFHRGPTDPATAQRPEVMRRLLECYDAEGGAEGRAVVDAGAPVDSKICGDSRRAPRMALARGTRGAGDRYRTDPRCARRLHDHSLPGGFRDDARRGGRKSRQLEKVFERTRLWELAKSAVRSVDPAFADAFTALAVTPRFRGSPHVDKCNVGPFTGWRWVISRRHGWHLRGVRREDDRASGHQESTGEDRRAVPALGAPYGKRSVSLYPPRLRRRADAITVAVSTPTSICRGHLTVPRDTSNLCLLLAISVVRHSANQRRRSSHPRRRRA